MSRRYLWMAAMLAALVACEKTPVTPSLPEPLPEPEEEDPWLFKDMSDKDGHGVPGRQTIHADFGDTRTQIVMNASETFAATVWSVGDAFQMMAYNASEVVWQVAGYSTAQGGSSVDFTSENTITFPAPYDAVYPRASKKGHTDTQRLIGVNLPSTQTAVAGGIAEGLTIAYACTPGLTEPLHFRSQVSMVRFRMTGGVVSRVRTVTLSGASSLSGDAIIVVDSEGTGVLTQDRHFHGDVHSSSVTLSGTFEAGRDYYIVLYPGVQNGFQMIFADEDGAHSTTLTASRFTFPRAEISDFGTIALGDDFTDNPEDTTPVRYMRASVAGARPVTLAVIPEGFTASELPRYEMLARSAIDALMATEPFNSYREYFNVWILKVASNESGANVTNGHGTITTPVDCYFGSKWGVDEYSDMAANQSTVNRFVSENCPDISGGTHTLQEVPILLIINDNRYGGICHYESGGGGYCMVPYTDDGGALYWSYPEIEAAGVTSSETRTVTAQELEELGRNIGNWLNTVVHEFGGHCFGRLTDEYWYEDSKSQVTSLAMHGYPVPYGLNISPSPTTPGWKDALLGNDLQVLPSLTARDSRYGRIGIFQGGQVSVFNRWRSERVSCMIDNRFYFSTWQRALIVQRIMELSGRTFDWDAFWAKDRTADPLRDGGVNSAKDHSPLPVRKVPMLPPPVLTE